MHKRTGSCSKTRFVPLFGDFITTFWHNVGKFNVFFNNISLRLIKNFSIELSRTNKLAKVIGLHPGTVDTQLSKPFQRNVSENKLFSPEFAASSMAEVIDNLADNESGSVFAFDGSKIDS